MRIRRWCLVLVPLAGCAQPDETDTSDTSPQSVTYPIAGRAQKGPFVNGSTLAIAELDEDFVQTGRTFTATLLDDTGAFSVAGVDLITPYARLSADGFFYDEVAGALSTSRIELVSYVDLSDAQTVNINLLGHLESGRILQLVTDGATFEEGATQAHEEVLAIFGFDPVEVGAPEGLDISASGAGNGELLALSLAIQGHRSVAEIAELLSAIQTDLRTDGTLDSPTSGSKLVNGGTLLDLAAVRAHLEQRYLDLGVTTTIPDFETPMAEFLAQAPWPFTEHCTYPDSVAHFETGEIYPNVLAPERTEGSGPHSLAAHVPEGQSLRVVITPQSAGSCTWAGCFATYAYQGWRNVGSLGGGGPRVLESTRTGDLYTEFYAEQEIAYTVEVFERGSEVALTTKVFTYDAPSR